MSQVTEQPGQPPHASPQVATFGVQLLLLSLFMLFAAGMLVYVLIRIGVFGSVDTDLGTLSLPWPLWLSTGVILLSSLTFHWALQAIRSERRKEFRRNLVITLLCGIGFLVVQFPSLVWMLVSHGEAMRENMPLYGAILFFVVVHALHVIGGLIPLGMVTLRALADGYDHEHHYGVTHTLMYWHFLDVVWLVMFGVFLALG